MGLMERTTADLLILMVAFTVCLVVVLTGLTVAFVEILNPATDTSVAARFEVGMVSTLVGLLAGYLAGRGRERKELP